MKKSLLAFVLGSLLAVSFSNAAFAEDKDHGGQSARQEHRQDRRQDHRQDRRHDRRQDRRQEHREHREHH